MPDLLELPAFTGEDAFNVVVESPRGSALKLKYSPALGAFTISRPLPLGLAYPFDWGFVPSTLAADGDPLDAAVCWDVSSYPGVVIECRALAVVNVEQHSADKNARVRNDRLIVVPVESRRQDRGYSAPLTTRVREELELFFLTAAALEGKEPRILGWDGPSAALDAIRKAARR